MTATAIVFLAFFVQSIWCSVPLLNIDGFSWAENLAFDGLGGLFVSEAISGQIWRISYDVRSQNYSSAIHIAKGFNQFGGLSITTDGSTLYAASIFADKSFGIISTSTKPSLVGQQSYKIVAQDLDTLCNGMMLVPEDNNALYCTSEHGTLTRIDTITGQHQVVTNDLSKPDGLWYDESTSLLFIGELVTKKMKVYDIHAKELLAEDFPAASNFGTIHMIDDLAVVGPVNRTNLGKTKIVAADWTGKQIIEFLLDGSWHQVVALPTGVDSLFEPTSVRPGKGIGFDHQSYYITEGGGLTRQVTNRRVLQLTPGAVA